MGAAAYAHATDGLFFDSQDSLLLRPDSAIQYARKAELDFPKMEAYLADFAHKLGGD